MIRNQSMARRGQSTGKFLVVAACVLSASALLLAGESVTAIAEVQSCSDTEVTGSVRLIERASDEGVKLVDIILRAEGLPPGKHAVHIHEVGTCTPCGDAKGHFDPGPNSNSNPDGNHPFHMGDLMNLVVNDKGVGRLKVTTSRVTLSPGPLSLFDDDGSAFIIHVDMDTYCPDGVTKGCAGGARAACAIIRQD